MSEKPTHFTIREWSKDDRPREKMLEKGAQSLSNAELMERNKGSYKKNFWTPKPKLFKDAKGGCPFDHDTPETKNEVQMEFDFK